MIPIVIEKDERGVERSYDIFSRLMKDRVILINGPIDENTSAVVTAQLLFLENDDPEKDIYMYINSPGGIITAGMAIHDTMKFIRCDVSTICLGLAASMGSFLLAAGTKGKRIALPNSEIMIHQPLGGAQGQASDIKIQAEQIIKIKAKLNHMLSEYTGQPLEVVTTDTDRDKYLTAEEALKYGIVDEIKVKRS